MQSVGALTDLSSRGEGRGETAMQGIEHKIEMVVPNNNCDSNCSYYQCNITMWMDVHFAQHIRVVTMIFRPRDWMQTAWLAVDRTGALSSRVKGMGKCDPRN